MLINWLSVKELRSEVGDEDFREIVSLFLDEAEEVVSRLKSKPALDSIEAELHYLKGAALNFGFVRLSDLCRKGELTARKGAPETVDLPAIIASYEESLDAFLNCRVEAAAVP